MLRVDTAIPRYRRSPQRRGGGGLMKLPGENQSGVLLVGMLDPANRDQ
jgi:hypothetical protein